MPARPSLTTHDPWSTVLNGARLKDTRCQRGLSRAELADNAGISRSTLARLERQQQAPCRCRTVARLAAALSVNVETLICSPGQQEPAAIGLSAGQDHDDQR